METRCLRAYWSRSADKGATMSMQGSVRTVYVATAGVFVAITLFFLASAFADRGFRTASTQDLESLVNQIPDESLMVFYTVTGMDSESQYLTLRLVPKPNESFGGGLINSWYLTDIDVQMTVDSLTSTTENRQTNYFFEGHPEFWIPYGSLDVTIDVNTFVPWRFRNSPSAYPFDTYPYALHLIVEQRPWSDDPIGDPTTTGALRDWEALPVKLLPWLIDVDGFRFDVRPAPFFDEQGGTLLIDEAAADWGDGFAVVEIRVRRLAGIRVLVGMIALVMILNLVALGSVVYRIATSQRPPSAQVLVWVAALSFATVAVRQSLPYSPPPGIALDYILFFPMLLFSAIATVVVGFAWSNRSDYCS